MKNAIKEGKEKVWVVDYSELTRSYFTTTLPVIQGWSAQI
jgi:hypothetical protein